MRMEAKKIAQQGNFKNIAQSVAKHHQKLMCAYLSDAEFFKKSIITSSGMYVDQ